MKFSKEVWHETTGYEELHGKPGDTGAASLSVREFPGT
jgi:hypothetical protein